jgi:aryl-alcohol dehydrogenase-like predicted oxidoreductase
MILFVPLLGFNQVLQTLGDLVRAGRIRYFGFSDMPAWYVTKAAALAQAHNIPGPIAMQLEYSLVERSTELEHLPTAHDGGLGVIPWSPLAGGFLSGKYQRQDVETQGSKAISEGRLSGANPFGDTKFTERNWRVLDTLKTVATEQGRPPAQVALAWASAQPSITSLLLGASSQEQLHDNLASLEVRLTPEQLQTLDEASALPPSFATYFQKNQMNRIVFGSRVQGWR